MSRTLPKLRGPKISTINQNRFRGFPAFVPTMTQKNFVKLAASRGMTTHQIAQLVINPSTGKSIAHTTLTSKFREEMRDGMALAQIYVAEAALLQAIGQRKAVCAKTGREFTVPCEPEPKMIKWWERTRGTVQNGQRAAEPKRSVIIVERS